MTTIEVSVIPDGGDYYICHIEMDIDQDKMQICLKDEFRATLDLLSEFDRGVSQLECPDGIVFRNRDGEFWIKTEKPEMDVTIPIDMVLPELTDKLRQAIAIENGESSEEDEYTPYDHGEYLGYLEYMGYNSP